MNTEKTKKVWIVWTNTDLTEGRGQQYPFCVTECKATAIRHAHKSGVMGSDASVEPFDAPMINGNWLVPARFENPSKEDLIKDKQLSEYEAACAKALAAGLDKETILALSK